MSGTVLLSHPSPASADPEVGCLVIDDRPVTDCQSGIDFTKRLYNSSLQSPRCPVNGITNHELLSGNFRKRLFSPRAGSRCRLQRERNSNRTNTPEPRTHVPTTRAPPLVGWDGVGCDGIVEIMWCNGNNQIIGTLRELECVSLSASTPGVTQGATNGLTERQALNRGNWNLSHCRTRRPPPGIALPGE